QNMTSKWTSDLLNNRNLLRGTIIMMTLNELLKSVDVLQSTSDANMPITGMAYHSQKVSKGDLFVCIRGLKADGHTFLSSAASNGAKAAVVEEINDDIDIPQFK